jgi:hypothetical protein
MSNDLSQETLLALQASALAKQLSIIYYALPCVTATVWLPICYLILPWYEGPIYLCASCLAWIAMRDRTFTPSWRLALLTLRISRIRYPLIALVAIYFLLGGRWIVLSLLVLTTPTCWLLKLFLLSGKWIETEKIEGRFFSEILEQMQHDPPDLNGKARP